MKANSESKTVFRSIWGWNGTFGNQLQTVHAVSPLLPAKLIQIAQSDTETVFEILNTSSEGLSELQSSLRLGKIGLNEIAHEKPQKWYVQFLKTFQNPLVILLLTLASIALLTEDTKAAVIIFSMVVFSVMLRFSQEFRSNKAAQQLQEMVRTTATVSRKDPRKDISPSLARDLGLTLNLDVPNRQEIPIKLLTPGDVVFLAAGDMIPADVRLISAKDLFVSQGSLTGESLPVEKQPILPSNQLQLNNPLELANLCFLGTNVISGTGTAVVIETGGTT